MKRLPAVAGTFYESSPDRLRRQVDTCFAANPPAMEKERFIGAVSPHAGLVYSGHVAAALYDRIAIPDRLIILCPNHTGLGRPAAIQSEGEWKMPMGDVPIDGELAAELLRATPAIEEDPGAHRREHSLEVQLPFLQVRHPGFRFVPLCLSLRSFEAVAEVGEAIARVVERHSTAEQPIGIIASSDMNHYENQEATLKKDLRALEPLLARDPEGLWNTVRREDISMCGFIPATTMLVAANLLGAKEATLVKHATSGDVSGDYSAVVGYASVIVS